MAQNADVKCTVELLKIITVIYHETISNKVDLRPLFVSQPIPWDFNEDFPDRAFFSGLQNLYQILLLPLLLLLLLHLYYTFCSVVCYR